MSISKSKIYEKHGIMFRNGKIVSPVGMIPEFLKEGNSKTGQAVYTFSILPGTLEFKFNVNGEEKTVNGSCACNCNGCYAKTGFYRMKNVINSLAVNTYLVNNHIDFVFSCIAAQLEIIGRGEIRIHASGDFNTNNSDSYAKHWFEIAKNNPSFRFWTYTKVKQYESLFDSLKNANVVKSVIPNIGVNFGKCEYIINAYYTLKAMDVPVYVCKCGIDKNQHCEKCGVCTAFKYVLFVEHSTDYKAGQDPLFPKLVEIVNNQ